MSHRRGVAGKQCKNLASVPAEKMPKGPTFTCFGNYMSLKRLQRLRHCCRNGSRTVQSSKTCWQSTSSTWSLSAKWVLGSGWGQRVTQISRGFVMSARQPLKSSQVTILTTAPIHLNLNPTSAKNGDAGWTVDLGLFTGSHVSGSLNVKNT